MEQKHHPFSAVINSNSHILILGTLPSVASIEQGFYYMHPQNRFWKVLSRLYEEDVYSMGIEEKREFILRHQLALFDVISACQIHKSSDQSIRFAEVQDIQRIVELYPIKRILLNGKKAYELFKREYPDLLEMAVCLPSTSPANAKVSLEELTAQWKKWLF